VKKENGMIVDTTSLAAAKQNFFFLLKAIFFKCRFDRKLASVLGYIRMNNFVPHREEALHGV